MSGSQQSQKHPSQRWTEWHAALRLATQRAAHKWTYEDFAECFPLWTAEESNGVAGTHATITKFFEDYIRAHCDELLRDNGAQARLDEMHAAILDARSRKRAGAPVPPDAWREGLAPRQAVRARTIPVLEAQRDRLKAILEKLEEENTREMEEVQVLKREESEADSQLQAVITQNTEISDQWEQLPIEDMQSWTLQLVESLSTAKPTPP